MKKTAIILMFVFIYVYSIGQIQTNENPVGWLNKKAENVPYIHLAEFDFSSLIAEDELNKKNPLLPMRIGRVFDIALDVKQDGVFRLLDNGDKMWTLGILSKNAYSLSIHFQKYKLPKGAKLFLYNTEKTMALGAFTEINNKKSETLSLSSIGGESLIIQYIEPKNVDFEGVLKIDKIVHDYNDFFNKNRLKASGSCNVNINCPEGDDWQTMKRAVLHYSFHSGSYQYVCTGTLIANTAKRDLPYVLTADHCISNEEEAKSAIFYFNYETLKCDDLTANKDQAITSSDLIATTVNHRQDWALLKLSAIPPFTYEPFYAGWNRSDMPAKNTTCMHHPQGDPKKISKDDDAPIVGDFFNEFDPNTHWRIMDWELGTTEGGSSGSALFDENQRIVGGLTGGDANCANSVNDYFFRFDKAWDSYLPENEQLKAWLDPTQTGSMTMDGYDPYVLSEGVDIQLILVDGLEKDYCGAQNLKIRILVKNKGTETVLSIPISYTLNGINEITYNWEGILEANETTYIDLAEKPLEVGDYTMDIHIQVANDNNTLNNILNYDFIVHGDLQKPIIYGDYFLCARDSLANYRVEAEGKYQWTVVGGNLLSDSKNQTIEVDWNPWGERTIKLELIGTCGAIESDPMPVYKGGYGLRFDITTDQFGEDISWYIVDIDGNKLLEGDGYENETNASETMCLTDGCYEFKIMDAKGDGIIDGGSYSLENERTSEVIASGSDFGAESSKQFCLEPLETADYHVYPVPARESFTIEGDQKNALIGASIELVNANGSIVYQALASESRLNISTYKLYSGVYLLRITSIHGIFSKKIIISR